MPDHFTTFRSKGLNDWLNKTQHSKYNTRLNWVKRSSTTALGTYCIKLYLLRDIAIHFFPLLIQPS